MANSKTEQWRCGRWALLGALVRVLSSLAGGIIMFAVWLVAVLSRMPRPPVPPSFAVTLTSAVVTAVGFAMGMLVAERHTLRREGGVRRAFLWPLVGGTVGVLVMFPFGGMMAGFGLFGLGMTASIIREVLWLRERARCLRGLAGGRWRLRARVGSGLLLGHS